MECQNRELNNKQDRRKIILKKSYSQNEVLINNIYYPVKTLGFGERIGIWFQGCTIHCKGCMSKYTWDFDPKYSISYDEIFKSLNKYKKYNPFGITISGGEPFDQSQGLFEVLKICHTLNYMEIMLYSGYKFDYLSKNYSHILNMVDILISGPFIESLPTNKIWRGSANQEIHLISKKAIKRYKDINLDTIICKGQKSIQFEVSDDFIFIIGIPRRGDLKKIKEKLKNQGVIIWQK